MRHCGPPCVRLEFAGVLFSPAFDDDLFVRVELDGVATLRVHVTEETAFPSGEGEIGHGRGDADIDANVACGGLVTKPASCRTARSEKGSLVAVGAAFEEGDGLVHASGVDQA